MTDRMTTEGDGAIFGAMHEQDANGVIAAWLGRQKPWTVSAERRGVMQSAATRPDIVIREGDRMPVIMETEYGSPAASDAKTRLGKRLEGNPREFTEVIAVGIDERVQRSTSESLTALLDANAAMFTIQLVSGRSPNDARVWPESPLPATPADVIAYCEYAQVPQSVIEGQTRVMATRVRSTGIYLRDGLLLTRDGERALPELMRVLGCDTDVAAGQTACAIWLITIDLQNDLAAHNPAKFDALGLKHTDDMGIITKRKLLDSWRIIEHVNYLPVVELAIPSLELIPQRPPVLADIFTELIKISEELNQLHAKHIYNFAGELWQELVTDREQRAAHYTKPAVAELLAALGASRFSGRSAAALSEIDLMDAACGTGTLVGAGERSLRRLHRLQGGRERGLHKKRMENHIIAIDVNGIAGTLTAKRLTDMDVEKVYDDAKIAVTDHEAGSLSLLDPSETAVSRVLGYRNTNQETNGNGVLFHVGLEEAGVDWSLMNPPYTRPFRGRRQSTKGLPQLRAKAKRRGYTLSNGQAGLASDFGNLSCMRLKGDGVLSHVLPLTAAYAGSWQQWREGIETHFRDIVVIANTGVDRLTSMSADTGMSEMLLVATKRGEPLAERKWEKPSILCVNIHAAPATLSQGYALANEINAIPADSLSGSTKNVSYARISTPSPGFPWYGVGNSNAQVSAVASSFLDSRCDDPAALSSYPLALDMTTLGAVCGAGPTHHLLGNPKVDVGGVAGPTHDLIGYPAGGDGRGAFEWTPIRPLDLYRVYDHKSLWAADAKAQTRMIVRPTHWGEVEDEALARRLLPKKSHWFINRGVSWTSQSLLVAKTREESHGGSAWNALQGLSDATGACVALFYNSIFGALIMRMYGQSPQQGPRARVQVGAIPGLPCPDFGADTPEAARARMIGEMWFDGLAELELEPFPYCFRDESRHQIDSVAADMLGLDPASKEVQAMLARYRLLFSSEPNVNGGKEDIMAALEAFTS